MKWTLIFFCIIEILAAIVQWNDPDPWLWIIIYLIPCVLTIFYLRNKLHTYIPIAVLIVYLLYFSSYVPSITGWVMDGFPTITGTMKAETKYVELVREGGGLLICITHLALLLYRK
ncbi:transmembrane 220 family protein [Membranihabitans marinus]|uniref:transmembrane 220 family protein n=1 Tax=Membranihabitans marinus TaxID=1227546 RepID=UPI001F41BF5A|nr:transmembrane 220 family protein [Membranihabitans marinus]